MIKNEDYVQWQHSPTGHNHRVKGVPLFHSQTPGPGKVGSLRLECWHCRQQSDFSCKREERRKIAVFTFSFLIRKVNNKMGSWMLEWLCLGFSSSQINTKNDLELTRATTWENPDFPVLDVTMKRCFRLCQNFDRKTLSNWSCCLDFPSMKGRCRASSLPQASPNSVFKDVQ